MKKINIKLIFIISIILVIFICSIPKISNASTLIEKYTNTALGTYERESESLKHDPGFWKVETLISNIGNWFIYAIRTMAIIVGSFILLKIGYDYMKHTLFVGYEWDWAEDGYKQNPLTGKVEQRYKKTRRRAAKVKDNEKLINFFWGALVVFGGTYILQAIFDIAMQLKLN